MTKEQLKELGLSDEQADAIAKGYEGFIPKSRFDELNERMKAAESTVKERDKQLESLSKSSGDVEALKAQIEGLKADNNAAGEKYAAELRGVKINSIVEKALLGAKARNLTAAKALLDLSGAELDGEGVKGLDERIKALTEGEDTRFLFGTEPTITGAKPAEGSGGLPRTDPGAMTYDELVAYQAAGGKLE